MPEDFHDTVARPRSARIAPDHHPEIPAEVAAAQRPRVGHDLEIGYSRLASAQCRRADNDDHVGTVSRAASEPRPQRSGMWCGYGDRHHAAEDASRARTT